MSKALADLAASVKQPEPKAAPAAAPKKLTTMKEKWEAVNAAGKAKGSLIAPLMRLGSQVGKPIPSICTNLPTLDNNVFGCGGAPRGRIIEIFGPESSGKTTLALHILGCDQKNDNLVAFVDAEHALDPNYASKLGVDVDNLIVAQPDFGEQALETVDALIESGAVSAIVVDSVAALVPKAELDGDYGDSHMGLHARLMSQAMRKLNGKAATHGVNVMFINQIREKVGVMFGSPEVTTGGRALKFYSSVRLDVRRVSKTDGGEIKSGDVQIGHRMKIKAVKNKVGTPFRQTVVDLIYGVGIDTVSDLTQYAVDLGAIKQSGAWFDVPGGAERVQGLPKVKALVAADPKVLKAVQDEIAKARKAIEEEEKQ